MTPVISEFSNDIKIITPNDGYHYFFAYYDMRATGKDINKRHLCHRVSFMDRLPEADDVCELGYLENGRFVKFAETTAWNFQQGAMLQYHPTLENTVFYNVIKDGKFATAIHNFESGKIRYTDRATATVSPNGKYGLGVNFGRIYAFRAGYGYVDFVDEGKDTNAPTDDGVFLVAIELATGKSKTLLRSFSPTPSNYDIRCDLHARFILGGSYISYDTIENGKREIAVFPTSCIKFD